jgi:hypothetical protein
MLFYILLGVLRNHMHVVQMRADGLRMERAVYAEVLTGRSFSKGLNPSLLSSLLAAES